MSVPVTPQQIEAMWDELPLGPDDKPPKIVLSESADGSIEVELTTHEDFGGMSETYIIMTDGGILDA